MKFKYVSVTGDTSEVSVPDEVRSFIIDDERRRQTSDKRYHRHCLSLNAMDFESKEYSSPDFTVKMFDDSSEQKENIKAAFSHLTSLQQQRILLLAKGYNIMEISDIEGKDYKTVYDSIEAAKKKFLKFYKNTP